MKLNQSNQTDSIASAICHMKGHHIMYVVSDTGQLQTAMCIQCGATLKEIRGEDATGQAPTA